MTDWAEFPGLKMTWCERAAKDFKLWHVRGRPSKGLAKREIHTGGNGGYQAVNLAYLMGAKRICLLGYDQQMPHGQAHWHGRHRHTSNPEPVMMKKWVTQFQNLYNDLLAEGVEVINATQKTALTVPRMNLDDCLTCYGYDTG